MLLSRLQLFVQSALRYQPSVHTVSRYVAMLEFVGANALGWMGKSAVSASEIVWVNKEYGTVGQYDSLETVVRELQEAIDAQNAGKWRGLHLRVVEDYGNTFYIQIEGQRPENAVETAMRLNDLKAHEAREREAYERLKEKFDGPVKEKKG